MAITLKHDAPGLVGSFAEGQAKRRSQLSKYGMDMVGQQQKYTQDNLARMQDYFQENQRQLNNNTFQLRRDDLEGQRMADRDKMRHQYDTELERAGFDNEMQRLDKQQEWDAERRYQQREWELAQEALDNGELDPPFDTQLRDNLRKEAAILSNRKMDPVQRQTLLDRVRGERDMIMANRKPRKPKEASLPDAAPDIPSFHDFYKQNFQTEMQRLQKQQEQAKLLGEPLPFKDVAEMRKAAMDMIEQDYNYIRNRVMPPDAAQGVPVAGQPSMAGGSTPVDPQSPGQPPATGVASGQSGSSAAVTGQTATAGPASAPPISREDQKQKDIQEALSAIKPVQGLESEAPGQSGGKQRKASDGMTEEMKGLRVSDPSDYDSWSSGMTQIHDKAKDSRSRSIVANAMKLGEKAHPRIRQALSLALDRSTPRDQRMAAVAFLMANGIQLRNLADK